MKIPSQASGQVAWDALRAENHALIGQIEKLTRARNVEIALIEDYGRVVEGLTMERDDLQLAFSRCNETKTALQMNLREAHKEREGIAAQNQALRDALGEAMGWNWLSDVESIPDSVSNQLADALTLPDTSADILRARDARVLRDAAEICDEENKNWDRNGASHAADVLRWKADKLEQKNG